MICGLCQKQFITGDVLITINGDSCHYSCTYQNSEEKTRQSLRELIKAGVVRG